MHLISTSPAILLSLRRWLLAFCLGWLPLAHAERVEWLYSVEVPADSQSVEARREAAGRALREALGRVAGKADISEGGRTLQIATAQPDRYYNQFRYLRDPQTNALRARFEFSPAAVVDLAKRLNLPVWWVNRPRLLLWTLGSQGQPLGHALKSASGDQTAAEDNPFVAALELRARQRGIPLLQPQQDELGDVEVAPRAIANADRSGLRAYSTPYEPEALGAGSIRKVGGGVSGSWTLWIDGRVNRINARGQDLSQLGSRLADNIANTLAARFAVAGVSGVTRMSVAGVVTPRDYAQLLSYLNSLEFIDDVSVNRVGGGLLYLDLASQASVTKLLELFAVSGRLSASDSVASALAQRDPSRFDDGLDPGTELNPPPNQNTPAAVDLATLWSGPRNP